MMTTQKFPMTITGAEKLKDELNHLKHTARPNVIKAISEARSHGDLKENAEYHAAKEQQSFIEGRIADIEAKLGRAQIIDVISIPNHGKIIFGATATIVNLGNDEEITYQIVGEDEADIKARKISVNSPIARGLIGKEIGDVVNIQTPSGVSEFEVLKVEYL